MTVSIGESHYRSMVSKEAVKEYKELYGSRYGVALSDEEAGKQASDLLNLYRAVFKGKNEKEA